MDNTDTLIDILSDVFFFVEEKDTSGCCRMLVWKCQEEAIGSNSKKRKMEHIDHTQQFYQKASSLENKVH